MAKTVVKPDRLEALIYMVSQGRFELPTFPLGGGCSIQLSYWDTVARTRMGASETACMLTAPLTFVMSSLADTVVVHIRLNRGL